jgi:hypothetical protein
MKKLSLLFLSFFIIGMMSTSALFGQTAGDFRSAQSGTWGTLSTWETYNGTIWVAATSIPDSLLAPVIKVTTIRSPHNVTVDATIGVRNVIVDAGATVTVNGTPVILYSTQEGITVNGTLTLTGIGNATAPYSVSKVVNPLPGTITIGSTGIVNMNQTQSTTTKVGLPIATWSTGSTLNVNSTGGAAQTGWGAGGAQDFGNINFNSPATGANFGWGFTNNVVNGNFTVLSTGTGTNRLQFFGGSNGTLEIKGDLIVSGKASVSSNGSGSVTHDTLTIDGNVNVNTSGDFSVSKGSQGSTGAAGGDTTGTAIWYFKGDVSIICGTMANSFKPAAGGGTGQRFVFKKSGTQNLSFTLPTASTGNIFPMEVVAGTTVNLQSPVNVSTLYLSGGIIVSSTTNPLIMGWVNAGAISGGGNVSPIAPGSSTSFVSGPMAYLYATLGGTTTKVYPIGKDGIYRPLTLSFTQTTATPSTYTAEMINGTHSALTLPGTLLSVSSVRYYKITETAGGSAITNGQITLNYGTDDAVTIKGALRIAKDNGSGSWLDLGGSGSANTTGTISSSVTFTSFGDFILAQAPVNTLTLTAFIEGPTNSGGTAMENDHWPITVTVELHNSSTYALVESHTGTLSSTGVGTFAFTTAADATPYYIVVKSANSIETWSAAPQSFTAGALSYNFTTAAEQAFGSNMVQKGSKWCIFSGDVSKDATNIVDGSDVIAIDNDNTYGVTDNAVTDITGDGIVDGSDVINVDNNNTYGISRQAPGGAPIASKHVMRPSLTIKQNIK